MKLVFTLARFLLLFVWVQGVISCGFGDGGTLLSGYVTDQNGKPVQGAKVKLSDGHHNEQVISKNDGFYKIMLLHAPSNNVQLTFTVSKEGYNTLIQKFTSGEYTQQKNHDVQLETTEGKK